MNLNRCIFILYNLFNCPSTLYTYPRKWIWETLFRLFLFIHRIWKINKILEIFLKICVYMYSKTLMQHVYLYYLLYFIILQSRLVYCKALKRTKPVYCKTREAPTTATIGKVGFQSKQWIGCRPNTAYPAEVEIKGTLGPCNRRVSRFAINESCPIGSSWEKVREYSDHSLNLHYYG